MTLAIAFVVVFGSAGLAMDGGGSQMGAGDNGLEEKLQRLKYECARLTERQVEVEWEQEDLKRRLKGRLSALYKFRALGYASTLFAVHDLPSFMGASHLLHQIGSADRDLQLRWHETLLRTRHLAALLTQRQRELATLEEARVASSAMSPGSNSQVGFEDVSRTAEPSAGQGRSSQSGAALLKKIPLRKPVLGESVERFSALRGTLSPPTVGEIVLTYGSRGDKRTETFLHGDGVTFVAPKGQPVEAVFDGVVAFSGWLKDYGNVMIIDHGDHYHSLIAHAERLVKQVGDPVKRGELVATVGSTGTSRTAQLYFEIRHHGKPVNPMEWLASGK